MLFYFTLMNLPSGPGAGARHLTWKFGVGGVEVKIENGELVFDAGEFKSPLVIFGLN